MNATQTPKHCNDRAIRWRGWFPFCLFAMIAIVLSFGQAEAAQVGSSGPAYVATAADIDAGCNGGHALSETHCCAGVACAEYAQHEATAVPIRASDRRFLPAVHSGCIGQTLRPTLQPPRA